MRPALALLVGLLGCRDEAGVLPQALTGGMDHDGHPEVGVLLFDESGAGRQDGVCTGTLITPRTVLTAAHCLGMDMTGYGVTETMTQYRVVEQKIHPDWRAATPYNHDVALAILDRDLAPMPARLADVAPDIGQMVTMVGVGETSRGAGDEGPKRIGINTVDSIETLYFETQGAGGGEANGCNGDSGGPVFVARAGQEAVAGIMSYVPGLGGAGCGPRMWSVRVDAYLDWIRDEAMGEVQVVDVGPPALRFASPADGATVEEAVTVTIEASDPSGVTEVTLELDSTEAATWNAAPFQVDLTLTAGAHTLSATATDAVGNERTVSIDVSVPDPTAPPTDAGRDAGAAEPADAGRRDDAGRPDDAGLADRDATAGGDASMSSDVDGGCSTSGRASATSLWLLLAALTGRRRRLCNRPRELRADLALPGVIPAAQRASRVGAT